MKCLPSAARPGMYALWRHKVYEYAFLMRFFSSKRLKTLMNTAPRQNFQVSQSPNRLPHHFVIAAALAAKLFHHPASV
jgi:hypothetical protein